MSLGLAQSSYSIGYQGAEEFSGTALNRQAYNVASTDGDCLPTVILGNLETSQQCTGQAETPQAAHSSVLLECSSRDIVSVILEEQRAFQRKSLENQQILITEQREVKALLVNVLSQKTTTVSVSKDPLFGKLPVNSEETLAALETALSSEEDFNRLVWQTHALSVCFIFKTMFQLYKLSHFVND